VLKETMKGAAIAAAVATMLASGARAGDEGKKGAKSEIKCAGVNSCKGTGSCSSKDNSCSGKNGCKGKGWIHTDTERECKDKGGTVLASK
jgi:uncharacterized membrane protein